MDNNYKFLVQSIKNKTSDTIEKPSFDIIKPLLFFYHKQLLKMSVKHISTDDMFAFEGSIASFNGIDNSSDAMIEKMKKYLLFSPRMQWRYTRNWI